VDVIGVRTGAKNGYRDAVGPSKKCAKAPKFGKAVKFANRWILL